MKPITVDDATLAFPAGIKHLMPLAEEGYKEYRNNWHNGESWGFKLFNEWFSSGISDLKLFSKEGIDPEKATRHIRAIMSSFEPSHEDKAASCAFLFEHWFEKVEWKSKEVKK